MCNCIVLNESLRNEARVSATPQTVKRLIEAGFHVAVECGAGEASSIDNEQYREVGAEIVPCLNSRQYAHLVLMVSPPTVSEVNQFSENSSVISFLYPTRNPETVAALRQRNINLFAMDLVPRITRAQGLDALSSQSNIAGYKAALLAASECPKLFPLMMTAAGTLRPAKVVVLGAGVAGLQAVATARRLGALVSVSDVRPTVKEQVESLGAEFIELPLEVDSQDSNGYAKATSEELLEKQKQILLEYLKNADAVITTAFVAGREAPTLITEAMVSQMKSGSVLVDLAAEQGGNCELTRANEVVDAAGVKIFGVSKLESTVPVHASEAYAKNVLQVVLSQLKDGKHFSWNLHDEIVASALITRGDQEEGIIDLEVCHFTPKPISICSSREAPFEPVSL